MVSIFLCLENVKKMSSALSIGSMKNALSSVRKIEFPRQDPNPLTKLHHQTSRVEHI